MVVSGTNSGSFCKDFGSVLLSGLTGRISVVYTLSLPDGSIKSFTEHYTPDDGGVVRINDLGELAFAYFDPLPMVLAAAQTAGYTLLLEASVYDAGDVLLGGFSQKFFYANCRTSIETPHSYRGFLSRHHRRKIGVDQAHFVGFFLNGQQLGIGVSYKKGDTEQWVEFQVDTPADGELYYRNFDVQTLVDLLRVVGLEISPDDVFYYIIYLKADGIVQDAMQVDVDRTHYSATTHMVYHNCFGVPDSLRFTGKDNRSVEMDAAYINVQRHFLKINTRHNIYHDVNTGYINEVMRDCAEDLVNSEAVYLYHFQTLGDRVSITEVNFDEIKPRTEPVNVRIKYRLAAECQRTIERDMTVDYRIFDHTFGDTFE